MASDGFHDSQTTHEARIPLSQMATQIVNQIQAPALSHSLTVKLEEGNYILWKNQLLNILIANGLDGYIIGQAVQPSEFLDKSQYVENLEYVIWVRINQLVMSWIYASLSPEPMGYEIQHALQHRYESPSTARVMSLRAQLQQLNKESSTISQYLDRLKSLIDFLIAVGESVSYYDHLDYLLEGLHMEYDSFITAVYNLADRPSIEEVQSLLIAFDL